MSDEVWPHCDYIFEIKPNTHIVYLEGHVYEMVTKRPTDEDREVRYNITLL